MKRLLLATFALALAATTATAQTARRSVSILGDSYSTFAGCVTPAENLVYYPSLDVCDAEQTWWSILVGECGLRLEHNCSYSGSTVCNTGYDKADYSDRSFITRASDIGSPDIILVFGGTNDSWAGAPVGENTYGDWTAESLYSFRPALCKLFDTLLREHPEAAIFNIENTGLSEQIASAIEEICDRYGIANIRLHDIDKQHGHPTAEGMRRIAAQVGAAIRPEETGRQ
ncbi:MAG: SGNH/GDSL hydrolase family protein [Alistipes sp.]|nr:SGNH/GDSL hydrolase family protein [Alistipes sp.]